MSVVRPDSMTIGGIQLAMPIYFPSVSSTKTALPLLDYVRSLAALGSINNKFLVSAYDYIRASDAEQEELRALVTHAKRAGTTVLMDSGNYESYWNRQRDTWLQTDFHRAIAELSCPLAFGFDEQEPPNDFESHVRVILERQALDQAAGSTTIIPIVHGKSETLPGLCAAVANATGVPMIAVPERGLGNGVFQRASTVKAIRKALDTHGRYVGLHLLGTGNPISLALYSIAGADSFDGLEWCQTVVDHETALLFHFSQADFFSRQTKWGDNDDLSFHVKALAHNLEFYTDWMKRLRQALHVGDGVKFCKANFPHRVFSRCAATMSWEG